MANRGAFRSGQDARRKNPKDAGKLGGRPGLPAPIREALEASLPKRIARMEQLAESADARIALEATRYLIDQTMGRPPQGLDVSGMPETPRQIVVRYVR